MHILGFPLLLHLVANWVSMDAKQNCPVLDLDTFSTLAPLKPCNSNITSRHENISTDVYEFFEYLYATSKLSILIKIKLYQNYQGDLELSKIRSTRRNNKCAGDILRFLLLLLIVARQIYDFRWCYGAKVSKLAILVSITGT